MLFNHPDKGTLAAALLISRQPVKFMARGNKSDGS
jgi:hypothetical protein